MIILELANLADSLVLVLGPEELRQSVCQLQTVNLICFAFPHGEPAGNFRVFVHIGKQLSCTYMPLLN